jgi:hypothetical protein
MAMAHAGHVWHMNKAWHQQAFNAVAAPAGMHCSGAVAPRSAVVKPSPHLLQAWVVLPAL